MAKFNRPLAFQSYKKDTLCYVAVQSVATVELKAREGLYLQHSYGCWASGIGLSCYKVHVLVLSIVYLLHIWRLLILEAVARQNVF